MYSYCHLINKTRNKDVDLKKYQNKMSLFRSALLQNDNEIMLSKNKDKV